MAKSMAAMVLACLCLCMFLLVIAAHGLTEDGACINGECVASRGLALLQKRSHIDDFREQERVSTATFESARPPSCCSSDVSTSLIWSRDSTLFANNISDDLPVVVPCGHELTIDESIAQILPGLEVRGSVKFQDGVDIVVKTSYVFVCGSFSIGRSTPHISKVDIVLTGGKNVSWPIPGGGLATFGSSGFITFGGDTYIRGSACEAPAWTRLAATVREASLLSTASKDGKAPQPNLALGRSASQSSLGHHRYTADKAVDGKVDWSVSSILTQREENPWWSVQLSAHTGIGSVIVTERPKRGVDLSGATVGVANTVCRSGHLCGGVSCSHVVSQGQKEQFDCQGARGLYVYVQMPGEGQLTFSEVAVFEKFEKEKGEEEQETEEYKKEEVDEVEEVEEEDYDGDVGAEFSGNLAFGQPSKQSSVAHSRYTAEKAVDGIFHWKGSSILTKVEENPWWYVEIPAQANIGTVTLSNRGHRGVNLATAIVGLTSSLCTIGHLCGGEKCIHSLTRAGKEDFDCGGARGAYLYVQLSGLCYLTLSEVEVYSVTLSRFDLQLQGSLHLTWKKGDKLIITSTSSSAEETEEVSVVSTFEAGVEVSGRILYKHEGCATDTCVMGAEVASMSRNVVIRGVDGCDPVCGHFMIAHTPRGYVCGVEFTNLGQTAAEGRYPLHVHMPGEAPDIVLKGNALHHNINRGLVLHGVHNATVESNFCFRTKGHCFMLEDAVEQHNLFKGNMGVLPSPLDFGGCKSTHGDMFCPDRGDNNPNPFWISNPNNIFLSNLGIATGVAFNFEPRHVRGLTRREFPLEAHKIGSGGQIKGRVPLEEFRGNMAHSSGMGLNNYPRMCLPSRPGAKNTYEDFTAWRCGVGMSAHNSPTCRMPFVRARLYENDAAARGGLSASRIDLIECKMTARNDASIPLMINRYGNTDVLFLPQVFRIDSYTRSWTRCHGGFENNQYFTMFADGDNASRCPPE